MSQHLEIEFKNLLTEQEFHLLKEAYQFTASDFFIQENHYFDTKNFSLKELQSALRIREKDGNYEMTLKQPSGDGLLETNQILSKTDAKKAFEESILPSGIIQQAIQKCGIDFHTLEYFGSLRTERAEKKYREGLLVLDHSYYLNVEDFEVEYEVENYELGQKNFTELLNKHHIPHRLTNNKIQRFYERKIENDQ